MGKLLALKKEHDRLRGVIEAPKPAPGGKGGKAPPKKKEKDPASKAQKETGLGLTTSRDDDFGAWYSQVVVAGELIEYYDIRRMLHLASLGVLHVGADQGFLRR